MVQSLVASGQFEEFVARYGDDPRYELIDGELIDMEPTGPHEQVSGYIIAVARLLATLNLN